VLFQLTELFLFALEHFFAAPYIKKRDSSVFCQLSFVAFVG
jgi:hypothetical protein